MSWPRVSFSRSRSSVTMMGAGAQDAQTPARRGGNWWGQGHSRSSGHRPWGGVAGPEPAPLGRLSVKALMK